ncbi:MAG: DUF167 family protein YggU [Termitinemataceae bacterium]|nr:MAG: DUF167 family protein YggU [Termitinemataceae bacterium]
MPTFYKLQDNFLKVHIKVSPGASKSAVVGIEERTQALPANEVKTKSFNDASGHQLKIKIAAQPEDGKANAALIRFLSKQLACPKSEIAIINGEKSRCKTIKLPLACKDKIDALQFCKK